MSPVEAIFVPFPSKKGISLLYPRPPPIVERVFLLLTFPPTSADSPSQKRLSEHIDYTEPVENHNL